MAEQKATEPPRINQIDLVNSDLQLSELKYHFLLRKVPIPPNLPLLQFTHSAYTHFQHCELDQQAICTVQIAQTHENNFFDILVGFRRDKDAFAVFKDSKGFVFGKKQVQIQLTDIFQMLLEARGSSPSVFRKVKKELQFENRLIREKSKEVPQRNEQRSRSRDKQNPRKETWAGKLYGLFSSPEWSKQSISALLTDTLRCAKNEILIQEVTQEEIKCFLICLRSQTLITNLMSGTRATEGFMLLLKQQEITKEGLQQSIRQRQLRATRVSTTPCNNPFNQLCKSLTSFRQFNLRVVTVVPLEGSFIVVVQNKVQGILKFLKIGGWKFQIVPQWVRVAPVLIQRWHKFLTVHKLQ